MRRATLRELPIVIRLIEEAAAWLRTKGTDQWAHPWPTLTDRNARLYEGLAQGKTWIAWNRNIPAATITAEETANPKLWKELEVEEPAVYVNRLVVGRGYAGRGLGAAMLDWAGRQAFQDYGARWIRIDVWTTNRALHEYYEREGFAWVRNCADLTYPSGALFQRPAAWAHRGCDVELITESNPATITGNGFAGAISGDRTTSGLIYLPPISWRESEDSLT